MNYEFIGWQYEEKSNTDKVWGIIRLDDNSNQWATGKFISFWGRRGKKLQTKAHTESGYAMRQLASKKEKSGYEEIMPNKLNQVYPEFEDDLKKTAMWATLKM